MSEILWPLVTLAIAGMACFAFCRWLSRETKTVAELKAELAATQDDWGKRFNGHERAFEALDKRVAALRPDMNPLGSTYSTRRPG